MTSEQSGKTGDHQHHPDLVGRDEQISVNIGILGHVDCGKTSLCMALSTTASTAAFDSNPQSKERGITIDLGFSAFPLDNKYNVTLVDCPGHASLIRTVLGGIRIIDLMILVVDVTKGMQTQSWECLILADIILPSTHLIVALNKVDLIPQDVRAEKLEKIRTLMKKALKKTRFGSAPMVLTSALNTDIGTFGTEKLKEEILKALLSMTLERDLTSPFVMAVDHCFNIRGVGAICTGTILQGQVKINDNVEFPALQITKKVKTMQIFKVPVDHAHAGNRVALGIPGLDSNSVERALMTTPGLVPLASRVAIVRVHKIPFFKDPIQTGKRYHISIGYSTITGSVTFFCPDPVLGRNDDDENFHISKEYLVTNVLGVLNKNEKEEEEGQDAPQRIHFAMLYFDKPVLILPNTLIIASNLQQENETLACRLAFHGRVVETSQDKDCMKTYVPSLNLFCYKMKRGVVDRVSTPNSIIVRGFCQKNSNINHIVGLKVHARVDCNGVIDIIGGTIEGRFGKTDKLRVILEKEIPNNYLDFITKKGCIVDLKYKEYKFKRKAKTGQKLCQ